MSTTILQPVSPTAAGPASADISVVIPTFKRAATLDQVLPSYLLPQVREILIVDDCSPDNTAEVASRWAQRDGRIHYLRQPSNQGVCAARNAGVAHTVGRYVFFGEDDAYPLPDALARMRQAMIDHQVDIVGSRTIHLMGEPACEALARPAGTHPPVDLGRLRFWFNSAWEGEVPAVHAWMLVRREVFTEAAFDPGYIGSAYREETDFCFNAGQAGFKLWFCGRAVMIHLSRQGSGGQWARSRWKYERSAIRNNWRMLRKHHAYLKRDWNLHRPAWLMQAAFIGERGRRMAAFLWSRLYYRLRWYGQKLTGRA